ncbi:MAG: response regulator [Deltaproteobacteria bacterium]|nr:response regulator [Deltaproteobacteria bacterium]
MQKRIFLRILGLLALLIIVTGTVMSFFQLRVHRSQQISSGHDKIHFLARQFESLLMWDDRVAMRKMLVQMAEDNEFVRYAFISRNEKIIAHSFPSGIPVGLLNLATSSLNKSGQPPADVSRFKVKDDGVIYDLTAPLETPGIRLHMGLLQKKIDQATIPSITGIASICGLFFLLLVYPALKVANAITREVDEMTNRLKASNLALEERVAERTADLSGANQRLAEGQEQLAVTLRSIGDGVITTDVDRKIRLLNHEGEKLTGWTHAEAIGRPLGDVFHVAPKESSHPLNDAAAEVLNTGSIVNRSGGTILSARDGTERSIALSCAPIRDTDSQIIGVVLVFRDVTEKERLEIEMQRSEKQESIGVLAGGIAHDFNNFLAAIQGNIELARLHVSADDPAYEYLNRADNATVKASDLAVQLLTFSKGNTPVKKAGEIEGILREAADLALSGARSRCVFELQPNLPSVFVDAGQMGQVFHNLFLNAMQAMPNGGEILVQCKTVFVDGVETHLPMGRYVRIIVKDQGIGIPKEKLIKVFDPFFTTKPKGTGLGLAVVHSIVINHGGSIEIDSREGHGTTCTLYIPTIEEQPVADKKALPTMAGQKGRILVMDDEEMLRELLSSLLTRVGYDVECAAHGEEAIGKFRRAQSEGNAFILLILDLTIPGGVGGIETLRRIREQGSLVKAIAASGYSSDPVIASPEKYGFCASISKPFKIHEICQTVQNTLSASQGAISAEVLH